MGVMYPATPLVHRGEVVPLPLLERSKDEPPYLPVGVRRGGVQVLTPPPHGVGIALTSRSAIPPRLAYLLGGGCLLPTPVAKIWPGVSSYFHRHEMGGVSMHGDA